MTPQQALHNARWLLKKCRVPASVGPLALDSLSIANFGLYCEFVVEVVKARLRPRDISEITWFREWLLVWQKMRDSFDELVRLDPMLLYEAKNRASLEFHSSLAFVRYFRAGNRTSKTQSGYAEHYFVTTGQSRYRSIPAPPSSTFIIGVNFSKYATNVFEKKFLSGEDDNPTTPIFPEHGRWFHRYDRQTRAIHIACPACAAENRGKECRHRKSSITLFSDMEGWEVLQGGQYRLGHFDEHIREDFFNESMQRTQSVPKSGLIVTGTPLHGYESWETRRLAQLAEGPDILNRVIPGDTSSQKFVSMHEIDQFEAGIVPHDKIRMSMQAMDDFEIESRIYGRPAPLARNPVFDRGVLAEMRKNALEPELRGDLHVPNPSTLLEEVAYCDEIELVESDTGALRVWELPTQAGQYIIAVDTASGLAPKRKGYDADASCASVLRLYPQPIGSPLVKLVAQYHNWINPLAYAEEVKKLGVYFNRGLVVIELTGGLGRAVMLRMRELLYENIFRDLSKPELVDGDIDARMGVDTSAQSKPMMVGALQQLVRKNMLIVPCKDTIAEMVAFEQERTETGLTTRYRGAGGSHDDRVMSLVIGAYVAVAFPVYDFMQDSNADYMTGRQRVADVEQDVKWKEIRKEIAGRMTPDPFN